MPLLQTIRPKVCIAECTYVYEGEGGGEGGGKGGADSTTALSKLLHSKYSTVMQPLTHRT